MVASQAQLTGDRCCGRPDDFQSQIHIDPGESKTVKEGWSTCQRRLSTCWKTRSNASDIVSEIGTSHSPICFRIWKVDSKGGGSKDFRKAWTTACKAVGLTGKLRHNFRRTSVRDMVNNGACKSSPMAVTGHKRRNVFDRYHIVSPADLKAARTETFCRPNSLVGTILGTVPIFRLTLATASR